MTGSSVDRRELWAQVLEIYAAPGVQPACLVLQDQFGVDVMLLLFSLALGRCGRQPLDPSDTVNADRLVAEWRTAVVQPLRSVRRTLKGGVDQVPLTRSDAIRETIKRTELSAEEIEFDLLVEHHADRPERVADRGWAAQAIETVIAHFAGDASSATHCADATAVIAHAAEMPE